MVSTSSLNLPGIRSAKPAVLQMRESISSWAEPRQIATVIDALLRSYQGVLCAETGHIAVHEAGAIEFGGHKVLPLPHTYGKITAAQVTSYMDTFLSDENHEHMVMPGMVYISQPTEYGTLYSLEELTALSETCRKYHLPLYADGARLAYALASPENDVNIKGSCETLRCLLHRRNEMRSALRRGGRNPGSGADPALFSRS